MNNLETPQGKRPDNSHGKAVMMIRHPEVIGLAVLSCILTFLPVVMPMEGLFVATFAPFPLIVLAVKYSWRSALSLLALQGVVFLMIGGWSLVFFFSPYALVPLVIAAAIQYRFPMAKTVLVSVIVPLAAMTLLFLGASLVAQQSPQALLSQFFEHIAALLQERVQPGGPIESDEHQRDLAIALPRLLQLIFPALLVINHLFTNVLNYILVRRYLRHSHPPLAIDPEDLVAWCAPDHLVWVFLATGVAMLLPVDALSTLGLNGFLITLAVYLLQGVAIAFFWAQRLPLPIGLRWLLAFMVFLVAAPLCLVVCIVVGLFDLWVDFRRQRRQYLTP